MKRHMRFIAPVLAVLIVVLGSCSKEKSPTGPGSSGNTVVSNNAVVVEQEKNLKTETVTDNAITYTFTGKKPDISTGDVLVSGEGEGYLRKVTGVTADGGKITVQTEQAALTDIVKKGEIDTTFALNFNAMKMGTGGRVMKLADGVSITDMGLDLSNVSFTGAISAGDSVEYTIKITKGAILFQPELSVGVKIDNYTVNEFHALAGGSLEFDFDIEASMSYTIDAKKLKKFNFKKERSLVKFQKIAYQQIGFVPVVEVIEFEVIAGVEGAATAAVTVNTGFDQKTNIEVGARYENRSWSPVWEKSAQFNAHDTRWSGSVGYEVQGYVRPCLTVKFYNIAGPYLDAKPYIGFEGLVGGEYLWSWEITGGISANLGFDLSILDNGIEDLSKELGPWEKIIASNYQDYPKTFTLSGRVLESYSGLSGVSVRLTGAGKDTTATTISTGSYTFTGLPNGAYTLTPSKSGYTFTSPNPTITVNNANVSAPDIAATKQTGPVVIQGISFISIPGLTFQMGDVEGVGDSDEKPVHTVTLTGFEMSVYEITNAQYAQFLNEAQKTGDISATSSSVKGAKGAYNGQEYIYLASTFSSYPDARCWITYSNDTFSVVTGHENWPVVWVTWYGSKAFALYYGLDLPTEAEWEYACRGGKQNKYGTDDGTLSTSKANYWDTGIKHPVAVGSYPKNPFGLYDMSGNVLEWCHDWYGTYQSGSMNSTSGAQTGSYRVIRGGGWGVYDYGCRSAARLYSTPSSGSLLVGFRVVRRVSPQNY